MKDRDYELTLLYDFFGELLTEKQREYFELYYNDDLSLAEIAENDGISRQGVRDALVRAEKFLRGTEEKTGVVRRFLAHRADADRLDALAGQLERGESAASTAAQLRQIADRLRK